jgi:TP901 family phage tail tape measure protein
MAAVLEIILKGIDQASPALQGVAGNANKLLPILGGAGLGGVLLSAGKATNELDNAMASLSAQTGLTGEDLQTVRGAVKDLYKSNIEGQQQITKTASEIISRMHVAAKEVKGVTNNFLDFARVTKQDSSAAVADFDDILDSWGLTVKDSSSLMDKLVVSQQKFGTQTGTAQKALAQLAPTFKALNLQIDDALGFINAFSEAGVDASTTTVAFNSAVKSVSGAAGVATPELKKLADAFGLNVDVLTNLNPDKRFGVLVERLSQIEDPAVRAGAAMELFGAKAGTKLAAVLDPTRGGLEQFTTALQGSEGASAKAADTIDGTITAKLTLLGHQILGRAQDLTEKLGPGFQIVAALAGPLAPAIGAIGGAVAGMGANIVANNPAIQGFANVIGSFAFSLPGVVTSVIGLGAAFLYVRGQAEGASGPLDSLHAGFNALLIDVGRLEGKIPILRGLPGPQQVKEWDDLSDAQKDAAASVDLWATRTTAGFTAIETQGAKTGASLNQISAAKIEELAKSVIGLNIEFSKENTGEFYAAGLQSIVDKAGLTKDQLKLVVDRAVELSDAGPAGEKAIRDQFAAAFDALTVSTTNADVALAGAKVSTDLVAASAEKSADPLVTFKTALDEVTGTINKQRSAISALVGTETEEERQIRATIETIEAQIATMELQGRQQGLSKEQVEAMTLALRNNKSDLELNRNAIVQNKEAAGAWVDLLGVQGVPTMATWTAQVSGAAGALGITKQQFDSLPPSIQAVLAGLITFGDTTTGKLDGAANSADRLKANLNNIPSYIRTDIDIITQLQTATAIGSHQKGGVVRTPFQIVGERGPELAALPVGTQIFSNAQSRQMVAPGGGDTYIFNLEYHGEASMLAAERFGRRAADAIRRRLR